MKNFPALERLLWLLLSVVLFVAVIPMPGGLWMRLISGFVFYLFVWVVWLWRSEARGRKDDDQGERRFDRIIARVKQYSLMHKIIKKDPKKEEENKANIRSQL